MRELGDLSIRPYEKELMLIYEYCVPLESELMTHLQYFVVSLFRDIGDVLCMFSIMF